MLDDQSQAEVNAVSRTVSVIVLALCAGIIAVGVYVLFFYQPNQEREAGLLTPLSFGFCALQILLSFTVPRAILNANRKRIADGTWQAPSKQGSTPQTDAGKLAAVYQTTTIISSALLESAAFFSLFAHMFEGHFSSLVTASIMLLGILSGFPSSDRLHQWVEHELRMVRDERATSSSK